MLSGQDLVDYIGRYLRLQFEIITNVSQTCKSKLTLTNDGNQAIYQDGWSIYSYHMCHVSSNSPEFDVDHVVGELFQITPTKEYKSLLPSQEIEINLTSDDSTASRSYCFPNWYVTKPGCIPRVIKSTTGELLSFVKSFDDLKKWRKSRSDKSNPMTSDERYERCVIQDLGAANLAILPTPHHQDLNFKKPVDLSEKIWTIIAKNDKFSNEVKILSTYLDIGVLPDKRNDDSTNCIIFSCEFVANPYSSNEGYKIDIEESNPTITLRATTSAGMFYAVQSLISLIETKKFGERKIVPSGVVTDAPRFPYRGLHIDVSRNFVEFNEILKIIHVMSTYKMNKLHFHLTDDEGWRIEIKDLPELTEIGSKRDHNLSLVGLAIAPTLGSGPNHDESQRNFYSVEEYQAILKCASEHHVQVIPEIDMPGHSYAAIVAMTARYHKYRAKGDMKAAEQYMLIDLDDKSSCESVQKYVNNTMNPCLNGTKNFVNKIVSSLIELHEPVQPLKIFHVGGDEVPVGAWDSSSLCGKFYEANNLDGNDPFLDPEDFDEEEILSRKKTAALEEYFLQNVESLCDKKNLQLGVWNDAIRDPTVKQLTGVPKLVHAWRISKKNDRHNPNTLANSGYQVVISSATHTYFDHPYERDPEEPGLTWCVRMMDTKTVFGMKPYDMYGCQDESFEGKHEKLHKKSSVQGIQCHIWSELIRNREKLEFMLFPRLLAIAERAWHHGDWEDSTEDSGLDDDWCSFANTLAYKELRRLDEMGIDFRIPPPGIKIEDNFVMICSMFPNLKFRCKEMGSESWKDINEKSQSDEFITGKSYEFVTMYQSRMSRAILKTL